MAIPNLLDLVRQTSIDYPEAWANAHTGNSHTEDFIKILARRCYVIDPAFGLNGKRGNPDDLSDDALNYVGEGGGQTQNGLPCSVIDVISGAGGPNPQPAWQVFPHAPEANGAWVRPDEDVEPVPEPEPEPLHVCPPCPPVPQTFPYPDENTTGKAFQARVKQAYTDAHRPFPDPIDQDAFRHFMRYGYSCRSMPEPEANDKHIKELRAQLGV